MPTLASEHAASLPIDNAWAGNLFSRLDSDNSHGVTCLLNTSGDEERFREGVVFDCELILACNLDDGARFLFDLRQSTGVIHGIVGGGPELLSLGTD